MNNGFSEGILINEDKFLRNVLSNTLKKNQISKTFIELGSLKNWNILKLSDCGIVREAYELPFDGRWITCERFYLPLHSRLIKI